jgi:hypothetical protein
MSIQTFWRNASKRTCPKNEGVPLTLIDAMHLVRVAAWSPNV